MRRSGSFDRLRSLRGQPGADQNTVSYIMLVDTEDEAGLAALRTLDVNRLPWGYRLILEAVRAVFAAPRDPNARRARDDAIGFGSARGPPGDPEAVPSFAVVAARPRGRARGLVVIQRSAGGGLLTDHTLRTPP